MTDSEKYQQPSDVETGSVDASITEPLQVNSKSGTTGRIAQEATLTNTLSREIAAFSAGTLPVEQQTPVGLEDTGAAQINPAEQEQHAYEYTSINLNPASTPTATTVYNPADLATVYAVDLANGGSSAEVRLQVTDGTNTAVIAEPAAGAALHVAADRVLSAGDELQVVVETAEGSSLTETAGVSRGEL